MRAASAGEIVIEASCARQCGSLLVLSRNWGHLSCTCCWSLHWDIGSPSLRHVSYPAPQSSVNAGCTLVSAMKDSHTKPSNAPSVLWYTDVHTNMIKATWNHVKLHLRPCWENEVKCVINRFKGSLSSEFDDVPQLIVKNCFCLILFHWTIYSIYLF